MVSLGLIIAVSAVAAGIVLLIVFCVCRRRYRKKRAEAMAMSPAAVTRAMRRSNNNNTYSSNGSSNSASKARGSAPYANGRSAASTMERGGDPSGLGAMLSGESIHETFATMDNSNMLLEFGNAAFAHTTAMRNPSVNTGAPSTSSTSSTAHRHDVERTRSGGLHADEFSDDGGGSQRYHHTQQPPSHRRADKTHSSTSSQRLRDTASRQSSIDAPVHSRHLSAHHGNSQSVPLHTHHTQQQNQHHQRQHPHHQRAQANIPWESGEESSTRPRHQHHHYNSGSNNSRHQGHVQQHDNDGVYSIDEYYNSEEETDTVDAVPTSSRSPRRPMSRSRRSASRSVAAEPSMPVNPASLLPGTIVVPRGYRDEVYEQKITFHDDDPYHPVVWERRTVFVDGGKEPEVNVTEHSHTLNEMELERVLDARADPDQSVDDVLKEILDEHRERGDTSRRRIYPPPHPSTTYKNSLRSESTRGGRGGLLGDDWTHDESETDSRHSNHRQRYSHQQGRQSTSDPHRYHHQQQPQQHHQQQQQYHRPASRTTSSASNAPPPTHESLGLHIHSHHQETVQSRNVEQQRADHPHLNHLPERPPRQHVTERKREWSTDEFVLPEDRYPPASGVAHSGRYLFEEEEVQSPSPGANWGGRRSSGNVSYEPVAPTRQQQASSQRRMSAFTQSCMPDTRPKTPPASQYTDNEDDHQRPPAPMLSQMDRTYSKVIRSPPREPSKPTVYSDLAMSQPSLTTKHQNTRSTNSAPQQKKRPQQIAEEPRYASMEDGFDDDQVPDLLREPEVLTHSDQYDVLHTGRRASSAMPFKSALKGYDSRLNKRNVAKSSSNLSGGGRNHDDEPQYEEVPERPFRVSLHSVVTSDDDRPLKLKRSVKRPKPPPPPPAAAAAAAAAATSQGNDEQPTRRAAAGSPPPPPPTIPTPVFFSTAGAQTSMQGNVVPDEDTTGHPPKTLPKPKRTPSTSVGVENVKNGGAGVASKVAVRPGVESEGTSEDDLLEDSEAKSKLSRKRSLRGSVKVIKVNESAGGFGAATIGKPVVDDDDGPTLRDLNRKAYHRK